MSSFHDADLWKFLLSLMTFGLSCVMQKVSYTTDTLSGWEEVEEEDPPQCPEEKNQSGGFFLRAVSAAESGSTVGVGTAGNATVRVKSAISPRRRPRSEGNLRLAVPNFMNPANTLPPPPQQMRNWGLGRDWSCIKHMWGTETPRVGRMPRDGTM